VLPSWVQRMAEASAPPLGVSNDRGYPGTADVAPVASAHKKGRSLVGGCWASRGIVSSYPWYGLLHHNARARTSARSHAHARFARGAPRGYPQESSAWAVQRGRRRPRGQRRTLERAPEQRRGFEARQRRVVRLR
jgi:hypothetical protein